MSTPDTETSPSGFNPVKRSAISLFLRLLALLAILAIILFLPAGRLDWLQAWIFILVYGGFLLIYATWVLRNDPGQLSERSQMGANVKSWDRLSSRSIPFCSWPCWSLPGWMRDGSSGDLYRRSGKGLAGQLWRSPES